MQHFAIVAMPRSGSTRLCEIVDSHPAAICHHELFHSQEVQAYLPRGRGLEALDRDWRDAAPAAFLGHFLGFAESWFRGYARHGFKILLNGAQGPVALEIVCPMERLAKIVLRRDNLLAWYTSRQLALATGVWQRARDAPADGGDHKIAFDRQDFCKITERQVVMYRAAIDRLRQSRQRFLELEYAETLTPAGLDGVWRFLGLPPTEVESPTRKMNTRPLLDCYSNPGDVRAAMRDIGRQDWLDGDGPAPPDRATA